MTEHNFEQMRRAMVASQLRTTGVNDSGVLAAMGAVPRERFVPADRVSVAYADALVPLPGGRQLNSPMVLGRLLTEARPSSRDHVLLIGAGTGYGAAVLARLSASVVAVEQDAHLAAVARSAVPTEVKLVEGSLAAGYAAGGPYDLVVIDGAVEQVPQAVIDQLKDGGRLATGIVDQGGVTRLAVGRKAGSGFGLVPFADAAAAVLPGFERPRGFSF